MVSKVKGTEGIEFPDGSVQSSAAFTKAQVNAQVWQDMTASRALGTTYTNDTAQQIQINMAANSSAAASPTVTIDGSVTLFGPQSVATGRAAVTFNVPSGATYSITLGGTVSNLSWKELR